MNDCITVRPNLPCPNNNYPYHHPNYPPPPPLVSPPPPRHNRGGGIQTRSSPPPVAPDGPEPQHHAKPHDHRTGLSSKPWVLLVVVAVFIVCAIPCIIVMVTKNCVKVAPIGSYRVSIKMMMTTTRRRRRRIRTHRRTTTVRFGNWNYWSGA